MFNWLMGRGSAPIQDNTEELSCGQPASIDDIHKRDAMDDIIEDGRGDDDEKRNLSEGEYRDIVKSNPILSNAVSKIRSAVADLDLETYHPDKKMSENIRGGLEAKMLLNFLNKPANSITKNELLSKIVWQQMAGGGYLRIIRGSNKSYQFNIASRSEFSEEAKDGKRYIIRYSTAENLKIPLINSPLEIEAGKEFAIKININAFPDGSAWEPLKGVILASKMHSEAYRFSSKVLAGKIISDLLVSPPKTTSGDPIILPEEQKVKVVKAFEARKRKGSKEAKTLVVGSYLEVQPLANGSVDFLSEKTLHQAAMDICNGLMIPPDLLGVGQGTYENQTAAKKMFYENTILSAYAEPILASISDALLTDGWRITPNRAAIEILRDAQFLAMANANKIDFLTNDEKRELFGYSKAN